MPEQNIQTGKIPVRDRRSESLLRAVLKEIRWENNIYLHLDVQVAGQYEAERPLSFYLVSSGGKANALLEASHADGGNYDLMLNVTNAGYNLALPEGVYRIAVCDGDDLLCVASVDSALVPLLHQRSGLLTHNFGCAYCVTFALEDRRDGLYPLISVWDTEYIEMPVYNQVPGVRPNGGPSGKWKRRIKRYGKKLMQALVSKYYVRLHRRQQKKKNRKPVILFMSEQNEVIGGNLICVLDRMKERGMDQQYQLLTSTRSAVAKKDQYGMKSWLKTIRKVAAADLIFTDDHVPMFDWLHLGKKTRLVQLWHAGAGYKASGYARWGYEGGPAPFSCHRQYTYAIGESRNVAAFHAECFGLNLDQVLVTGMPRIDRYLNKERQEKVREELLGEYPLCRGKKVVLFAPTFRGMNKAEAYYPYDLIDFEGLADYCREKDAVILFRMHPWITEKIRIEPVYQDCMADAADYPQINDLFVITDLLITDYSSGVFEYALMNRPALFYAFDLFQYSYARGFHRDYRSSTPGRICATFDELLRALREEDYEFEKMDAYRKFHFDLIDEGATDRVIDWIVLDKLPEDVRERLEKIKIRNLRLKRLEFPEMPA